MTDKIKTCEFRNGLTVKELRDILKDWPDTNKDTGNDFEVCVETGEYRISPVATIILFETNAFD